MQDEYAFYRVLQRIADALEEIAENTKQKTPKMYPGIGPDPRPRPVGVPWNGPEPWKVDEHPGEPWRNASWGDR